MKFLLSSNDAKIRVSFEAMKNSPVVRIEKHYNFIEFSEISDFFLISFKIGLNLLSKVLSSQCKEELQGKGVFIPNQYDLDFLIKKYEENIKSYLIDSFKDYYGKLEIISDKMIPYEIFKKWIMKDHDLEIVYFNKKLKVAVTLMCLNDIGLSYD